jgi:hypothetical protein
MPVVSELAQDLKEAIQTAQLPKHFIVKNSDFSNYLEFFIYHDGSIKVENRKVLNLYKVERFDKEVVRLEKEE